MQFTKETYPLYSEDRTVLVEKNSDAEAYYLGEGFTAQDPAETPEVPEIKTKAPAKKASKPKVTTDE